VEHYYDHIEEKNNTGLVSFLVMHYYIEDGTDTDAAEDNQLPFKSAEHAVSFSFTSITPPAITGSFLHSTQRLSGSLPVIADS